MKRSGADIPAEGFAVAKDGGGGDFAAHFFGQVALHPDELAQQQLVQRGEGGAHRIAQARKPAGGADDPEKENGADDEQPEKEAEHGSQEDNGYTFTAGATSRR